MIWDKLVFSVVTSQFKDADMISGIRLLDKSIFNRESMFRIEIWTKFNSDCESMVKDLQTHLENEYIQQMIDDIGTKPLRRGANAEIAADWIEPFKNLSNDDPRPPRGPPGGHNRQPPAQ